MSLHFDPPEDSVLTHGHVHYRKRNIRAQNRRLKLTEARQRIHTFFDDEGNVSHKETTLFPDPPAAPDPELNEGYEAHSSSVEDPDEILVRVRSRYLPTTKTLHLRRKNVVVLFCKFAVKRN